MVVVVDVVYMCNNVCCPLVRLSSKRGATTRSRSLKQNLHKVNGVVNGEIANTTKPRQRQGRKR